MSARPQHTLAFSAPVVGMVTTASVVVLVGREGHIHMLNPRSFEIQASVKLRHRQHVSSVCCANDIVFCGHIDGSIRCCPLLCEYL
jgi:hypothetical protein